MLDTGSFYFLKTLFLIYVYVHMCTSVSRVLDALEQALTYIAQEDHDQTPAMAKCPLLRTAVRRIGSHLKPMISSSFPPGKPFQQRTENWDITDFTKWVP